MVFILLAFHVLKSRVVRDVSGFLRLRLHEQIKHTLFAQIRPKLLHTEQEFEQLKEILFAHVNAAKALVNSRFTTVLVTLAYSKSAGISK